MNGCLGLLEIELVMRMGPPNNAYTLADGSKVLQYAQSQQTTVPGPMVSAPFSAYGTGQVATPQGAARYSVQAIGVTQQRGSPMAFNSSCTVNFTVSSAGSVTSWNASGNMCRAD